MISTVQRSQLLVTYSLFPSPVTRHEIRVLPLSVDEDLMWTVINLPIELLVRQNGMNDFAGVTEPNTIFFCHPRRRVEIWEFTGILEGECLPRNMAEINCIDGVEDILGIPKWPLSHMGMA